MRYVVIVCCPPTAPRLGLARPLATVYVRAARSVFQGKQSWPN